MRNALAETRSLRTSGNEQRVRLQFLEDPPALLPKAILLECRNSRQRRSRTAEKVADVVTAGTALAAETHEDVFDEAQPRKIGGTADTEERQQPQKLAGVRKGKCVDTVENIARTIVAFDMVPEGMLAPSLLTILSKHLANNAVWHGWIIQQPEEESMNLSRREEHVIIYGKDVRHILPGCVGVAASSTAALRLLAQYQAAIIWETLPT